MGILAFDLPSYRNLLLMSRKRHLLVEGKKDRLVFKVLLDELSVKSDVQIDTAENIIDLHDTFGNREKVERVCESVVGTSIADKLLGFVDREFREFEFVPQIIDKIEEHKIFERLIWSRGHSIENYYFEFPLLREALRTVALNDYFREALDLFSSNLDRMMRLACAASLVGLEYERLSLIKGSIHWSIFDLTDATISINQSKWKNVFVSKQKLLKTDAERIVSRFEYWSAISTNADSSVIRWACHGHIGLAFIWATYCRCVIEVSGASTKKEKEQAAASILGASEDKRHDVCANSWARLIVKDQTTYPKSILVYLGAISKQSPLED